MQMQIKEQLILLERHARQMGMNESAEMLQRLANGVYPGKMGINPEEITVEMKKTPDGKLNFHGSVTVHHFDVLTDSDINAAFNKKRLIDNTEEAVKVKILEYIYPNK